MKIFYENSHQTLLHWLTNFDEGSFVVGVELQVLVGNCHSVLSSDSQSCPYHHSGWSISCKEKIFLEAQSAKFVELGVKNHSDQFIITM